MPRYALYFAPEPDSPWWHAGCQWLGRDAAAMCALVQATVHTFSSAHMHAVTVNARRYGFHATLKAPFQLADGCDQGQLDVELHAFCAGQNAFTLPTPQVQWMGDFLALKLCLPSAEMDALALRCIRHFSSFSAPLSATETARRHKPSLSARQKELLLRWDYPYTEEEFRFHLTLTDAQKDIGSSSSIALQDAAIAHFDISEPLGINSIALFYEADEGKDFELLKHYRFGL